MADETNLEDGMTAAEAFIAGITDLVDQSDVHTILRAQKQM